MNPYIQSLFDTVSALCPEHERAAFLEGVHVGARLAEEIHSPL